MDAFITLDADAIWSGIIYHLPQLRQNRWDMITLDSAFHLHARLVHEKRVIQIARCDWRVMSDQQRLRFLMHSTRTTIRSLGGRPEFGVGELGRAKPSR